MGLYTKITDLQKLGKAWEKVKKRHPAAGVDRVDWEEFDINKKLYLKQLKLELDGGSYQPGTVKMLQLQQDEKVREVCIFSLRDKVVQQSIAEELNKLYEPLFAGSCFAYRQGKSSLQGVEKLHCAVLDQKPPFVLRGDIKSFFDQIDQKKLRGILGQRITETAVLDMIEGILQADYLDVSGELCKKLRGIYQGSILAPVLSNIYLMDLDRSLEQRCSFYLRYSDDFIAFAGSREEAGEHKKWISGELGRLGLSLHPQKTQICSLKEGFAFLGYSFREDGKTIPKKAEEHLQDSLEEMWLTLGTSMEDKLKKGSEILSGWEQYYTEKRQPTGITEYVILLHGARETGDEDLRFFQETRRKLHNDFLDILRYLLKFWEEKKDITMALWELEDFYSWGTPGEADGAGIFREELYHAYQSYLEEETDERLSDLMQIYADMGKYQTADKISSYLDRQKGTQSHHSSIKLEEEITYTGDINLFMNRFAGREDLYKEEQEVQGHRRFETILQPLTQQDIRSHLSGERTIATFVQRSNGTAHFLVFDIDISKKILLTCMLESPEFQAYYKQAGQMAMDMVSKLRKLGLCGYIEESGCRGYHVWVLFQEWISLRYINMLSDVVLANMASSQDIMIECFPNKTHLKQGKVGQAMKLPCGIHSKTGRRSRLLEEDLSPVEDLQHYVTEMVCHSLDEVKRVISSNPSLAQGVAEKVEIALDEEEVQRFPKGVAVTLTHCSLMKYLYQKAKTTSYLTHGERLSFLYVFGHLGEEGKRFIHDVMEHTVNYQYHVTQKFIDRIPEKPVSCTKLREQYKNITAEYGCSCAFKRSPKCYPSPVLHAAKLAVDEQVELTVPSTRSISKSKEIKVREEINIAANVQKLAQKLQELRKQIRGLEKSAAKLDRQLKEIFDDEKVDCMEIEAGMLCRRTIEGRVEWYIEL